MQNKVIYLITTKNCEACSIMKKIIEYVIDNNDIKLIIIDYKDTPDFIINNIVLKDFPTVVLIKDNVIKYYFNGTISVKRFKTILKDIDY